MECLKLINEGVNVCLLGEFGVGKSFALKRLGEYFNTIVLSSNPSLNELQGLTNEKHKSRKEAFNYLLALKKRILLFDDVHESRKDTISLILRLCRVHTIVCASEKEIERLNFDFKVVKINRLSDEESLALCRGLISDENICRRICSESRGLPLLIIRGAEHYKVTGIVKKYFQVDWKLMVLKRLSVFAYLCLSIRYFARSSHNWELYSTLSTVAYALLALNRFNKKF